MNKIRKLQFVRWGLLVLSVVFIFVGIFLGENETVMKKAINICLECIGVG